MDQYNNANHTAHGLENVGHTYSHTYSGGNYIINNNNNDDSHTSPDNLTKNLLNSSADNADKSEEPPAIRIKLNGQYLIEASAGTGKTWTLTGIVLRLLIEAKRAPEHIIATTFTRAAAAEMRQRIHDRLVDFYQLLQWLNNLQVNSNTHAILYPQLVDINKKNTAVRDGFISENEQSDKKVSAEQRQTRKEWLAEKAKLSGNADLLSDPINLYLLTYLLDHTEDYPLADAIRRCALVLTTLDKLFVGTLDSLSQKWLSEYSAETGHQQGIQISDQEQIVIESIIHDTVRAHHSYLYNQKPEIYQLLQHTKRLTAPADHIGVAQKSMQFISTPIEAVEMGEEIDFAAYQQALDTFKNCDLKDIEPYFDIEFGIEKGLKKGGKFGKTIYAIATIQKLVHQYEGAFFANLDADSESFYGLVSSLFISEEDGGNLFKKKFDEQRQILANFEGIQLLASLRSYTEQIELYLDALIENLNRDIALKVRQKLPPILETRRETTFALQMVRLNQALSGRQGERLARYIRHHYPVALIDESQDINGEQARMIERIYLSKSNDSASQSGGRGFLLLVGDPKQAIYGFRGGDVANYNAMKAKFAKDRVMSLDVNRRSNERLITALNHWFGRPTPVADLQDATSGKAVSDKASQLAQLGKSIYYQYITAANKDLRLSWQMALEQKQEASVQNLLSDSPVSVIHLPYDKQAKHNACELTALHIAALLASEQTLEGRPIKPSDIGVLGRRKHELKQVEDMLSKLGVPTLETAEKNVFDTPIAADLAALLEAMLRPHRRDIINRVLTSNFYQMSLNDVQALMLDEDESETDTDQMHRKIDSAQVKLKQRYQDFQLYLKTAASHWQHNGILSALHYLFARNPMVSAKSVLSDGQTDRQVQSQNIWVGLADLEDGARYLMDLRHLLDILAQHGMHIGEHELLAWYKKNMNSSRTPEWAQQQPLPTESGVQLMTIHKSKGLEFPIVYVVGMDGASPKAGGRSYHNLFLYDSDIENNKTERRLSASKGKRYSKSAKGEKPTDYYAQFETIENYEELRRLAYVAFTRASEQLYMVFGDAYNKTDAERKPSLQWLSCEDHNFVLPDRLQPYIGWLEYVAIAPIAETILQTNKTPQNTNPLEDSSSELQTAQRIDYQSAYAQIQLNTFKGWAKTSFTALSRQLNEQSQALAVFNDGVEDELDLTDSINLTNSVENNQLREDLLNDSEIGADPITSDNIRFRFVKGANAGTFLHEIFEKIDFTDNSKWSVIIDQSLRQYQLPISYASVTTQQRLQQNTAVPIETDESINLAATAQLGDAHEELIAWVADVLAAPLLASGQPLQAIPTRQRIAELGFNMGLSEDFTPERINHIFTQYLPDEPEKHIELTPQFSSHIYRYLRGEIDLVYECAGKYYVVDYKSNYLGNSLSSYNNESLNAAMNKAGYWLQAAIYQVALHRFLRLRLKGYVSNEAQYLGAVEYVFLRGIDSKGTQNYGRIQWQIPFELVKALDEMFGSPSAL
ncbi:UvrD-helicase domain-containing protein [Psychrobacter sp. M9-54-1]|uniref:UvrD-helicase domain-containing protein n=1 Tax=Psychrobacter sp. M9-54-1 TaxID=2782386 RepID=UPI00190DE323|nr:UvrD-helicase domain-containing protein [Psychrobacter sp. M9-54-1]MBK3393215.1 UvrD-helicase domain-containing protein [Psychrobacter sp. M9-54-1]